MLDRSKKPSPNVGAEKERYLKEEQERVGFLKEKLRERKKKQDHAHSRKRSWASTHSPITAAYGIYPHGM